MVAVRFEKEQDSRKNMTGDARERSSRIPAGNGEADAYFSFARRARQYVEGIKKKKERYLCGPRLEAQLIGRAEAAVEGCRPGWFSKEHGVEILLRFLKTQCAKLALPDIGSHLQGFFLMLKRKKYEPVGVQYTEMSTPRSEEQLRDCDVLRSQKTWTGNRQMLYHRGI